MYNAQTSALINDSLDALHRSALACLAAGDGISTLAQDHARTVADITRRNLCGEPPATAQEWLAGMLDGDLQIAGRDACVHAAEHIGAANVALLEAARAVIERSQAWLLDQLGSGTATAADEESPAARPRRRQLAA